MKKVAIVGVEGSGKTVMLAGLGELYSRPDENGNFLSPKNFATASYVADKIARMRGGEWPTATAEDVLQGLDWTLKHKNPNGGRPSVMCEISCLDFAGEVYRNAFGINAESGTIASGEATALKNYIRAADAVIVLINLRDIIVKGLRNPRVQESIWITRSILQYAIDEAPKGREPRAALVLTQADSYEDTIRSCGGVSGVIETHLRDVANNYDWLDAFEVCAVDRTRLDDDGNVVPAKDFSLSGLRPIVDWILDVATTPAKQRQKSQQRNSSYAATENVSSTPPSPPPPQPSQEYVESVNIIVYLITLAPAVLSALSCLFDGGYWRAALMGVFCLFGIGARGNAEFRQGAGRWLLCAFLWLISGNLAASDHGWMALIVGSMGIGAINKEK